MDSVPAMPVTLMLPPVMLPVAEITPPVSMLLPTTLPAADINPPVAMLPPVMFAVTIKLPRVPIDVILG